MLTFVVVDTSYWLELFKVPKHFNEECHLKIKDFFKVASEKQFRLYLPIPIPVLFELANHIAHVEDGRVRYRLAEQFSATVKKGISVSDTLLNIVPHMAFSVANELEGSLSYFVSRFETEFVQQGLGFTDSAIILEADKLKQDINKVHIWTLDAALKAREPDPEKAAFLGRDK